MKTTQRVEFECCYISDNILNAHTYKVEVTVSGKNRYLSDGIVLKFENFRKYINQVVPHGTFLVGSDASEDVLRVADDMIKCNVPVSKLDGPVSCESLCEAIANDLQLLLYTSEPGVSVQSVRLREGSDSFASWGE